MACRLHQFEHREEERSQESLRKGLLQTDEQCHFRQDNGECPKEEAGGTGTQRLQIPESGGKADLPPLQNLP